MGGCLSRKSTASSSPSAIPRPLNHINSDAEVEKKKKKKKTEEEPVKKEIFIIKHRKSHDIDRPDEERAGLDQKVPCSTTSGTKTTSDAAHISDNGTSSNVFTGILPNGGGMVRTSSCTKEEVDAILIQCGRLSRSSSTDKAALSGSGGACENSSNPHHGRKYSGSKRSFDFDCDAMGGNCIESNNCDDNINGEDDDLTAAERIHRHRHSRGSSPSSSQGRRRTPSRERDQQQQRSGSRERGSNSGGRRVSRSPGRRSESPIHTAATLSSANASSGARPAKMVSVPATVSSLAMDKSNNGGGAEPRSATPIRRISVKRNAGSAAIGARTAASPRSRSPARAIVSASNENQITYSDQQLQQPLSLSRSNSRKPEQSPYRRNSLSEIDQNTLGLEQLPPSINKASMQKPMFENLTSKIVVQLQGTENKTNNGGKGTIDKLVTVNCRAKEQKLMSMEEGKGLHPVTKGITVPLVASGDDSLKAQPLTRTRSSRLSQDLDVNPEAMLNQPTPSYTALLLEDIQNFHQKNPTTTTLTTFSIPPCLTKACSILDAVADLNSSTSSNLSCTFSDDRRRSPTAEQLFSSEASQIAKKRLDTKDHFAETEVGISDHLMEPSLHKYVTVRRGFEGREELEEQESSGSNSFAGGQQHWVSSSSWEPNSADSTDRWTSLRFTAR